jgi:hypothetical protein
MNFFAYSDFDNTTRRHYTLAARTQGNTLFTTYVAPNGTAGALLGQADVTFPSTVTQTDITYLFTYNGNVYVSFTQVHGRGVCTPS